MLPQLSIDRREDPDLSLSLKRLHLRTEIKELPYGDIAFAGNGPRGPCVVGIERKRVRDLLNSMESGRLAGHQLRGMFDHYEYVYLLVEGAYRPSVDGVLEEAVGGRWQSVRLRSTKYYMYRDLDNYLNSLSTTAPIRVKRSECLTESAHLISDLYWFWSKDWAAHSSLKVIYDPPPPTALLFTPTLVRRVANQLPSIGWERSGAVAQRFSSVAAMVEASVSQWAEIPGIGKGIASKVYKALRTSNNDEGV